MELAREHIELRSDEATMFSPWLDRVGGRLLELGCGDGRNARALIAHPRVASVLALEADAIQHRKNLAAAIADPPDFGLRFGLGTAEAIAEEDDAFDMAFMFKSLHHVPVERMDRALLELHRVLRPGGIAYISEPVFAGPFNDLLALFHDESSVRSQAFEALERAVARGHFVLEQERFFLLPMVFASFAEFEAKVIAVTHTQHELSPALHAEVARRFAAHYAVNGGEFLAPQRVDVLRRC